MNDEYVGVGIKALQICDKFVAVVVIPFCNTLKKALKTFPQLVATLSDRFPEKHAYLFFWRLEMKRKNSLFGESMLFAGYKLAAFRW